MVGAPCQGGWKHQAVCSSSIHLIIPNTGWSPLCSKHCSRHLAMAVNSVDCLPSGHLPSGQGWTDNKISKIRVCRKVTCATEKNRAKKGLGVLGDRGRFGLEPRVLEDLLRRCSLTDTWSCAGGFLTCSRTSPCVRRTCRVPGVTPDRPVVVCGESSDMHKISV